MHDAEARQPLPALLADVAVHIGDLKGLLKEVGGAVAVDHNVGGHLVGRGQGADAPPVYPVTPGGVVFSRRVDADGEDQHGCPQKEQRVGQQPDDGGPILQENGLPVIVEDGGQGKEHYGEQQPRPVQPCAGGDVRIDKAEADQGQPAQGNEHPPLEVVHDPHGGKQHIEPHGDGGLIELLPAVAEGDEHIEHRCRHRQPHLEPQAGVDGHIVDAVQHDPADSRPGETHCHEPGPAVFGADVKMNVLIHGKPPPVYCFLEN